MDVNFSNLSLIVIPPIAGGIIGYFTNDIAIKMLFRPYRALYLGKYQIPFTPGLIPRNQNRLAHKVSDTIMESLLTPEELQKITKNLLQLERVKAAIAWLLDRARARIKTDPNRKTVKVLANILGELLERSLPRLLKVLSRREDFLEEQIDRIFNDVLIEYQLSEKNARQLANWIVEFVVPPNALRLTLVDFLTDRNIEIIDAGFRQKTSGTYWLVANVLGLKTVLTRLRTFCLDEKEQSNKRLGELIESLEIREQLTESLQNLSLQNLPVATVRQLQSTLQDSIRSYIQTDGEAWIQNIVANLDLEAISDGILSRLQNSAAVSASLETISEELATIVDRYLEDELETVVAKAIPILQIDRVIIDRVNASTPENVELAIQAIVKTELQAIVNLGGVLGVIVGCLQTLILLFR